MNFHESEKKKQEALIRTHHHDVFPKYVKGWGEYKAIKYDYVLKDTLYNLYREILVEASEYFDKNKIQWHQGHGAWPSGNTLSSQVACVNHLFKIRNDPKAVLDVLNGIVPESLEFDKVIKIESDEEAYQGYIAFEVISEQDHLNEGVIFRGVNCTSIDAVICAERKGENWVIPIEWKYTETCGNKDLSSEPREGAPKNTCEKGKERMNRYNKLIECSHQLVHLSEIGKDYKGSVYYQEPFYQLMRQTLWAEQLIRNKEVEKIKADKFLHIHVVPNRNKSLLYKRYREEGKCMRCTWLDMLKNKSRYILVDPEELLAPIDDRYRYPEYKNLCNYLRERYWKKSFIKD